MSKDAAQKRWKAAQKAAVANFKPITIKYTIATCPDCYGSRPQGNESAWAKGCKECSLFDECGKATEEVYLNSMTKTEWTEHSESMRRWMRKEAWERKFGGGWKGIK